MTKDAAVSLFTESGALLEGHFLLTSGLHSPRYIQCAKVLQYPARAELLCAAIAERYRGDAPDAVLAPAIGGIVVGQEVGRQLGARTMFAERLGGALRLRRGFGIAPGERILVCEDVITTGGSVREVEAIVRASGGEVIGVGAVVDRSAGGSGLAGCYAVLTLDVPAYPADLCPQCKAGIPVEKPGSRPDAGRGHSMTA